MHRFLIILQKLHGDDQGRQDDHLGADGIDVEPGMLRGRRRPFQARQGAGESPVVGELGVERIKDANRQSDRLRGQICSRENLVHGGD